MRFSATILFAVVALVGCASVLAAAGWEDTEATTMVWRLLNDDNYAGLVNAVAVNRALPTVRSADGRGGLWWAYEYKRAKAAALLISAGAADLLEERDADGAIPSEMFEGDSSALKQFEREIDNFKAEAADELEARRLDIQEEMKKASNAGQEYEEEEDEDEDEDEEDDDEDEEDEVARRRRRDDL